jgi:hypothetical protein
MKEWEVTDELVRNRSLKKCSDPQKQINFNVVVTSYQKPFVLRFNNS